MAAQWLQQRFHESNPGIPLSGDVQISKRKQMPDMKENPAFRSFFNRKKNNQLNQLKIDSFSTH